MSKIFIFILFLITSLILSAQEPLNCEIKGGVIDNLDDRPYLIIHHKNNSKQIFSYNDTHKEACIKNIKMLYANNNIILKKNRLYLISFSINPINKGEILSVEEELGIKVKVKQKNDSTNLKALIRCDMKEDNHLYTTFGNTEKFDYYSEYITRIESFVNTTKVLDMYTSPNLRKNPYLSFKLNKAFDPKNIKFVITNNKKLKRTFFKNNRQNELNFINNNQHIKAVFNSKRQDDAIKKMYGTIKEFKEGNITIQVPAVAGSGWSVPLEIISDIDAESMLVLTNSSYHPAVIAVFSTPYNLINYKIYINANYKEVWNNLIISVIIKDKKGNFYKTENISSVIHYTSDCT